MFTHIEARRFRSLRAVSQPLGRFRALVGPNGSGKTTFLDVVAFLSDLIRNRGDVKETVNKRTLTLQQLLWMGEGTSFQLAVEAEIPSDVQKRLVESTRHYTTVRYEIEVSIDEANVVGLEHETLLLLTSRRDADMAQPRLEFPAPRQLPASLVKASGQGRKALLTKRPGGNDNYYPEGRKSYTPSFKLGRTKSALAHVPADPESFPVSTWFRDLLESGVQTLLLNGLQIRQPSPPGAGRQFVPDGSNLPWAIDSTDRGSASGSSTCGRLSATSRTSTPWSDPRTSIDTWWSSTRMAPACRPGSSPTGRCACSP